MTDPILRRPAGGVTFEARLIRNRRNAAGALTDSLCFARLR